MRSWMRISLRTALIVITIGCLWMGYNASVVRRNEAAIRAIRSANGYVKNGTPWNSQYGGERRSEPRRSHLTRIVFGSGPGDRVCGVFLRPTPGGIDYSRDDNDFLAIIPQLDALGGIRELDLDGSTEIGNASVERLAQFKTLEVLNLCNVSVDDSAVDALSSLSRLKYLDVFRTKISLEGARRIQEALPNCRIRGPTKPVGFLSHSY